jgi:hypothetical protein
VLGGCRRTAGVPSLCGSEQNQAYQGERQMIEALDLTMRYGSTELGLAPSDNDNGRVIAAVRYLES